MKPALGVAAMAVTVAVAAALTAAARSTFHSDRVTTAVEQSTKAATAFDVVMHVHGGAIPRDLLARAKAVVVFPRVVKASSGHRENGRGVVTRRSGAVWGNPVFIRVGAGSVGPQTRAASTDYVLLVMNDESVQRLLHERTDIGSDAAVAPEAVAGRSAVAGNDAVMNAAILSYSSRRGLFAGVDVRGIVILPDDELNVAVYNQTARELLSSLADGSDTGTADVQSFPKTVDRYTLESDIIAQFISARPFIH